MIDAKSAQLLVTNKVKELQQAVQDAAAQNAALVNANLIDPEVGADNPSKNPETLLVSPKTVKAVYTCRESCRGESPDVMICGRCLPW